MSNSFVLYTGEPIPSIGFGTWEVDPNEVGECVTKALEIGYRHIDCAYVYQNEKQVGYALSKSQIPREKLFITSKLWNTFHRPELVEKACDTSINNLQCGYLDLYLMHWPVSIKPNNENELFPETNGKPDYDNIKCTETWQAMEKLVEKGKVKHIGVSNFDIKHLQKILRIAKIKPAVNQIETHPYNTQIEIIEFCKKNQIHVTGYSPLGSIGSRGSGLMSDELIKQISSKYKVNPAQVLISWGLSRTSVIPRSKNPDHIKSNFDTIKLDSEEIESISKLNKDKQALKEFYDKFSTDEV